MSRRVLPTTAPAAGRPRRVQLRGHLPPAGPVGRGTEARSGVSSGGKDSVGSSPFCHGKEGNRMLYAPKQQGQGLVEYALILVLVAVVVIVILALLGPAIGNVFSNIIAAI